MYEHIAHSLEETKTFAKAFAFFLEQGDVIDLIGEMGAGKTTFTVFLVESLGIEDPVSSPSFALVNMYEGHFPVYHMDFYRLTREEELFDLDFERYLYPERGLSILEWGERAEDFLPEDRIKLAIEVLDDGARRFLLDETFRGASIGEGLRACEF